MIKPKLAVTGYRGIWGDTLNEEIAISLARAFAMFVKEESGTENPTILVGRDGRESGPAIANAIVPVIEKLGVKVIYGDILPTPTMMLSVKMEKYDGGIIITASHNPIEYNGLKFITRDARMTNESEVEKIKKHYEHS
jgi:phosphomannomutase